jgi:MFS family permease
MNEIGHTAADAKRLAFVLRALRSRNYRLFFGGQIVSLIGTWMTNIATSWLVYRLTGSALLLGVVGFSAQLPTFLVLPFAGIFVDRANRHRLLIGTQIFSMAQSFALAGLTLSRQITIPWLVALSAFQGVVNAFDMPCRQAFVVQLIDKKEDLGNAIALNSSMFNAARIVGPAIAGALIAVVGEGWCFFVDGVSYAAVIAALMAMTIVAPEPRRGPRSSGLKELREGLSYCLRSQPIRSLIGLIALFGLMGVPYVVLMPVFAAEILHGGPHTLGYLMTAAGAGALTGALWLASRRTVLGLGRIISVAAGAFGAGLVAFSFSRELWLALACLTIAGCGFMIQMAGSNTILQTIVDDDKRGRVMSLFVMAFIGTAPFGSLLAGSVSHVIGVPHTLLISGVSCMAGAFWFYRQLPEIRNAVRPIYRRLGILPEIATGIDTASEIHAPLEE